MSNKALNWATSLAIPAGPKNVLKALADRGSNHEGAEDWTCWPSIEQLMDDTSLPKRNVERFIGWLREAGLIQTRQERTPGGRLKVQHYDLRRAWSFYDVPRKLLADWPEHLEHRLPEDLRSELPAIKAEPDEAAQDEGAPAAILAGGEGASPAAKTEADRPPKSAPPAANLAGGYIEEPSKEPSENPKRAPARDGGADYFWEMFNQVCEAVPPPMRKVTKFKSARSIWAKIGHQRKYRPEAVLAAAQRFGADPDMRRRQVHVGLEVWLVESMAEWLPREGGANPVIVRGPLDLLPGAPDDVVELIVNAKGEAFARSYLHGARWNGDASQIECSLSIRADTLTRELGRELRERGVTVIGPASIQAAE